MYKTDKNSNASLIYSANVIKHSKFSYFWKSSSPRQRLYKKKGSLSSVKRTNKSFLCKGEVVVWISIVTFMDTVLENKSSHHWDEIVKSLLCAC